MSQAQVLDPLCFPLHGNRLIEASAGTGKTFTIAALYVRLVLGHGGEQAFSEPLLPPRILVVTFTDAATKALRERIHARLLEAARVFRDPEGPSPDGFLSALLKDYPDEAERAMAARRLEQAAQWMDEAAVSTIHSWCYRALREHAFDSGSLFTQNLATDQSELLAEAVRDYWRTVIHPRDPVSLGLLCAALGEGPAALEPVLSRLLAGDPPRHQPPCLEDILAPRLTLLEQLKAPWRDHFDTLADQFRQILLPRLNGNKYRNAERLLEAMGQWAMDPGRLHPEPPGSQAPLEQLSRSGMQARLKKGQQLPEQLHPAFELLDQADDLERGFREQVLHHGAAWVYRRFRQAQGRLAQLGFDDLLTRLRDALEGPNGDRLAHTLRRQFPVALIDEFQDTDPVQYRIFERVYALETGTPDAGLFLIGDPKQSIYAFRGADIHTYLKARQATRGRHYTLGVNFRSTVAAVAGFNRLFALGEQQHPKGAFLFRPTPQADNPVPFVPVQAQGRETVLQVNGQPQPALTLWHLDVADTLGRTAYIDTMAHRCAGAMAALLAPGHAGFMATGDPAHFTPLKPRDMAVLVRDRSEANAIQAALRAHQIRSVYLSDRESVYLTAEADDLLRWLRACAEPESDRLLRAALATPTLDLSLPALERLNQDERHWENMVERFRGYQWCWRTQGVLPMVRRLMHDFQLPQRLFQQAFGERRLTNLLHLSELLQSAAMELEGEQALIRNLVEHQQSTRQASDEQILRLESDEDLVKVVTIHKAKGLQYPLVFLPFIAGYRPSYGSRPPLIYRDSSGQRVTCFMPDQEDFAQADEARLAEDVRLLYVAVTRACHACWLGVAPVGSRHGDSGFHRSALGSLLGGGDPVSPAQLAEQLEALRAVQLPPAMSGAGEPPVDVVIQIVPAPPESTCHSAPPPSPPTPEIRRPARRPLRPAREHWWIASYSALQLAGRNHPEPRPDPESAQEEYLREVVDEAEWPSVTVAPPITEPSAPLTSKIAFPADFPRGPESGTFLHGLLEWVARTGFQTLAQNPAPLQELLARRCHYRGWGQWIDPLEQWLQALLHCPLRWTPDQSPLVLGQLTQCQAEMDFWFQAGQVNTRHLDRLVTTHTLAGHPRPALLRQTLNGMMKGFIDLVFEHEGRYYVADYKSNWLGDGVAAYAPQALAGAVVARRYDLQYSLYSLALHRLLQARLPDYDYEQHMGGALIFFLRGLDATGSGIHFQRPGADFMDALDGLFARRNSC
ncbi:DNA helicase/exodeoxyribonuclease V, beta subunit [Ectothiorhodospira magna]|uniref:RecBCD enzyme subunit RecB n=1 Tax=Ectothiorhodospira magna TaxID=867345 RepID=A0A1H9APK2_9GAMM|nr:exodeoxyribonuclease V subunit beta [Ectothiorhodospira magna]SEP78397.1 DNA helicase/exodeoxyribonuclease V, beta subunit [Ectothiorhodospira magna]